MRREAECERAALVRGRHNHAAPPLAPLLQTGVYTGADPQFVPILPSLMATERQRETNRWGYSHVASERRWR